MGESREEKRRGREVVRMLVIARERDGERRKRKAR